jgi:hypothetical protein
MSTQRKQSENVGQVEPFILFMEAAQGNEEFVRGFLGAKTPNALLRFINDKGYKVTLDDCKKLVELRDKYVKTATIVDIIENRKCY